ncbi:hypothetical protein BC937DRAFT_94374 [Endogone sp. FLAS-F59071]|nr:hypothetical protein BC937DRAFT_94374 [Endogone sp. FLAS-F59071]|eukprot:RUS14082.1 hypothetical protein BC937DRAFT_94374 [Endogone sp. FLAS-F59071]
MFPSVAFVGLLLSFYLHKLCEATSLGPSEKQSACSFVYNNTLYVWGGAKVPGSSANFTSASLPLSTTNPIAWVVLSWNIPTFLANANQAIPAWPCVVSPTGILVVGGNNMFGYDLIANMYVRDNITGGNPFDVLSSRTNVQVVQVEDSLYVFGGYNNVTAAPQSDMYILNLTTWEWSVDAVNNPQSIPPNYDSPTLVYGGNGFIYRFGGSQNSSIGQAIYYSDIYRFDINARIWSLVTPNGGPLSGYDDATSVAYKGKVYIFDGGTNNWTSGVSDSGVAFTTEVMRLYDITSNSISLQTNYNFQYAAPGQLYPPTAVINDAMIVTGQNTPDIWNIWIYNLTIEDWTTTVAAGPYLPSHSEISKSTVSSSILLPPTLSPTLSAPSPSPTNLGVIIGPIVGGVVVIAVAAFFLIRHIRGKKSPKTNNTEQPIVVSEVYAPQTLYSHKPIVISE